MAGLNNSMIGETLSAFTSYLANHFGILWHAVWHAIWSTDDGQAL